MTPTRIGVDIGGTSTKARCSDAAARSSSLR
jgi:N-acetylglucosamine kinase-like BadF-type ATPase